MSLKPSTILLKKMLKLTPETFIVKHFKNSKSNKVRIRLSDVQDYLSDKDLIFLLKHLTRS